MLLSAGHSYKHFSYIDSFNLHGMKLHRCYFLHPYYKQIKMKTEKLKINKTKQNTCPKLLSRRVYEPESNSIVPLWAYALNHYLTFSLVQVEKKKMQ